MVIAPVNADVHEAQHVAQEYGCQWPQRCEADIGRGLHLQHHDGDDDRQHAVAECLDSSFTHHRAPSIGRPSTSTTSQSFTATTAGAPFAFTRTARILAGRLRLAFRPTT